MRCVTAAATAAAPAAPSAAPAVAAAITAQVTQMASTQMSHASTPAPAGMIPGSCFSPALSPSPTVPPPGALIGQDPQRGSRAVGETLSTVAEPRRSAPVPMLRMSAARPGSRGRPNANGSVSMQAAPSCKRSAEHDPPQQRLTATTQSGTAVRRFSYSPSRARQPTQPQQLQPPIPVDTASSAGSGSVSSGVFMAGGTRPPVALSTAQSQAAATSLQGGAQVLSPIPKFTSQSSTNSDSVLLADQVASLKEELEATGARRLGSVIGALIRLVTAVEAEGQACLKLLEREREERKAETGFIREELRGLQAEAALNGSSRLSRSRNGSSVDCEAADVDGTVSEISAAQTGVPSGTGSSGSGGNRFQQPGQGRNSGSIATIIKEGDPALGASASEALAEASAKAAAATVAEWQQQMDALSRECGETRRNCRDVSATVDRQVRELAASAHGLSDRLRNLEEGFCNMASLIPTVREEALNGEAQPPWETRPAIENNRFCAGHDLWQDSVKEEGEEDEQRIVDLVLARGDDFPLSACLLPTELPSIVEEENGSPMACEGDIGSTGGLARDVAPASLLPLGPQIEVGCGNCGGAAPPGAAAAEALTVLRQLAEARTE